MKHTVCLYLNSSLKLYKKMIKVFFIKFCMKLGPVQVPKEYPCDTMHCILYILLDSTLCPIIFTVVYNVPYTDIQVSSLHNLLVQYDEQYNIQYNIKEARKEELIREYVTYASQMDIYVYIIMKVQHTN